jgi:hypothetical protein
MTPENALTGLVQQAQQIGAMLQQAHTEQRLEYRLVRWDTVNDLAREGWVVQQAVGTWAPEDGHVTVFLMVRKLSIADEAAEILAR